MTWTAERPAAVAGTFYEGDPAALTSDVERMLAAAQPVDPPSGRLRGLIVPHAGHIYSGPVAATGYRLLRLEAAAASPVRRVVLLGPDHFVGIRGMAVPTVERFRTPLGTIPLDESLRTAALSVPGVRGDDAAHAREHSLEVQLPFLQRVLTTGWTLLPVVVGATEPDEVAALLAATLTGPDVLLLISTDLSHYHDHATAQRLDQRTCAAIEALDETAIGTADACGRYPLRGAMAWARRQGWQVTLLDRRTSADTAGDPHRVVGYGTFAITEPA